MYAAKLVKYFRYILADLNLTQDKATRMLIDNYAALCMVNEKKPTPRARHLDIQAYAIQDWKDQGDIVMEHLPGILNSSDDLTKALGWVPHSRHSRRGMGHCGPPDGVPLVDSEN